MNGKRRKGVIEKLTTESNEHFAQWSNVVIEIGLGGWVLSCFRHVSYVGRAFNVKIIILFLNCLIH